MKGISNWQGCKLPEIKVLEGRFTRLELLNTAKHGAELFRASSQADAEERHLWLLDCAPKNMMEYQIWLDAVASNADMICYAVIDKRTNKICGRQMFLRLDAANGSIEIGSILWNKDIARTPVATEALYLFAAHVFDDLAYRRFEWKCNNDNEPSKKAALRFGFKHEGLFRQNLVIRGKNRDTAWYSIIDGEWPMLKQVYENWLAKDNFDEYGMQKKKLSDFRTQ